MCSSDLRHVSSAQARVRLALAPDRATMEIGDDGGGFDVARLGERRGMGVDIMRERAAAIGAHLQIESQVGRGTTVTVRWSA